MPARFEFACADVIMLHPFVPQSTMPHLRTRPPPVARCPHAPEPDMRYRRLTFYASRCTDARDAARAAIIARAGEQHAQILAGDDRGMYGDYRPEVYPSG
jgi:hypothetical protein